MLKIDQTGLTTLPFADSSKAQVGDVVLAIGEPFGLGGTVTMGIISAKGRAGLGIERFEDFIQTDAAINHGNSGGALIDTRGELVGINTAILSGETGGNQGIGFAIPANLARNDHGPDHEERQSDPRLHGHSSAGADARDGQGSSACRMTTAWRSRRWNRTVPLRRPASRWAT